MCGVPIVIGALEVLSYGFQKQIRFNYQVYGDPEESFPRYCTYPKKSRINIMQNRKPYLGSLATCCYLLPNNKKDDNKNNNDSKSNNSYSSNNDNNEQ